MKKNMVSQFIDRFRLNYNNANMYICWPPFFKCFNSLLTLSSTWKLHKQREVWPRQLIALANPNKTKVSRVSQDNSNSNSNIRININSTSKAVITIKCWLILQLTCTCSNRPCSTLSQFSPRLKTQSNEWRASICLQARSFLKISSKRCRHSLLAIWEQLLLPNLCSITSRNPNKIMVQMVAVTNANKLACPSTVAATCILIYLTIKSLRPPATWIARLRSLLSFSMKQNPLRYYPLLYTITATTRHICNKTSNSNSSNSSK